MTPRQVDARHALGLNAGCLRSRGNHFWCWHGSPDRSDWDAMVGASFAVRYESSHLPPGDAIFKLTRAGAKAALLPGDVLDPEDWPA